MFFEENYSNNSKIKDSGYGQPCSIDLSKILTLSALVAPNTNVEQLTSTINKLKSQINDQHKRIQLLEKLRKSESIKLNEEKDIVTSLNADLKNKILMLSKQTQENAIDFEITKNSNNELERKMQVVLVENMELKLELLQNNNNVNKWIEEVVKNIEKPDFKETFHELKDDINKMRDLIKKSIDDLNNESANIFIVERKLQHAKSSTSPTRKKKIGGRGTKIPKLIKKISKLNEKNKHPSKNSIPIKVIHNSNESNHKVNSNDNNENVNDNSENIINVPTVPSISLENGEENVKIPASSDSSDSLVEIPERKVVTGIRRKLEIIKESSKSDIESQIDEKLEEITNLLIDIPNSCEVKNFFEKI